MDFTILEFINTLRSLFAESMPYSQDETLKAKKHAKTPLHIKDVALLNNAVVRLDDKTAYFHLGNEEAESLYPYYHILDTAQVIKKRDKGTKKSKGSQADVFPLKDRDYNIYTITTDKKGKQSINYEYRKNVRGKRSKIDAEGMAKDKNSYVNIHYNYVENNLDGKSGQLGIAQILADRFNMVLRRKQKSITQAEIDFLNK